MNLRKWAELTRPLQQFKKHLIFLLQMTAGMRQCYFFGAPPVGRDDFEKRPFIQLALKLSSSVTENRKNIPFLKYAPRESAKPPTRSPFIVNSYLQGDLAICNIFSVHNLSESQSHPYNLHMQPSRGDVWYYFSLILYLRPCTKTCFL